MALRVCLAESKRASRDAKSQRQSLAVRHGGTGCRCALNSDVDECINILGAASAAASALELELGLELAGHHTAGPSSLAYIRLCNPVAQAEVQGALSLTIMRSVIIMPSCQGSVKPPEAPSILLPRYAAMPALMSCNGRHIHPIGLSSDRSVDPWS
jgi:hypothetical protein